MELGPGVHVERVQPFEGQSHWPTQLEPFLGGRVTLADLMVASDKTYRIFLLDAGFSKPAGMPLAAELLR